MGASGTLTMGNEPASSEANSEAAVPRSIRRGPPITIGCECGERRDLHYGERWTCEKCGRTWDTRRIPLEEYVQLCRTQSRFRWIPLAAAALVIASLVALVILGRVFTGLLFAAIAAMGWSTYGRPQWKRRYLKAIQNRPSWNIEPE
jgi:hypothetical protein